MIKERNMTLLYVCYAYSLMMALIEYSCAGTGLFTYENIATNLPEEEFKAEDFKALYHLRWQEENSFRDLKYSLCLKVFHSKKYDYIVQEIWARVILYNFSSSIIINITIDREDRAYEYQANYSSALKTCRDFLRIHDGITKINVESLIAQNIEPIRPGRTIFHL